MTTDFAFLLYINDWFTPNTYDKNYMNPPERCGVYLLVNPHLDLLKRTSDPIIIYVGSTKNLHERYAHHEIIRSFADNNIYIQFYFKECASYIETEKKLINIIQPKLNKQWL